LSDLEACSLAENDVLERDSDLVEGHVHVAVRCVIVAHHSHGAEDLHSLRVHWNQDHAVSLVRWGGREVAMGPERTREVKEDRGKAGGGESDRPMKMAILQL
jgi:hypothetical protein